MREPFQRLFMMSGSEVLSLNAQAARGPVREPERSQFSHLLRHFLARFFNHETASPNSDAKARFIVIAATTGLPGFVIALFLWPVYHPLLGWPHNNRARPPYWLEVNHHLFYVVYSFVAVGIAAVFEWDMFFPDRLDLLVLQTLPVAKGRMFAARVSAIAILIGGFLFGANILASLALPAAIDPPNLRCFLSGHLLAVMGGGLFAAFSILALQGILISALGERLFRRLSLFLQVLIITALLMLLLLFPVLSGAVPVLLQSGSDYTVWAPPIWFLGIYQRVLEGPTALPIYTRLAKSGCVALMVTAVLAILAYLRRVRQLIEGPGACYTRNWFSGLVDCLVHAMMVRPPVRRAIFHFISKTMLRMPRYRIYLILYGGVGLSVIIAAVFRLADVQNQIRLEVSSDGIRAAVGIVAFWTIAGLRVAFLSPGNQQGGWVLRVIHGRPAPFRMAMDHLLAAKTWALLCGLIISCGCCMALHTVAPPELCTFRAMASQFLAAAGMSVLLADILFLNVKTVALTGERIAEESNFAISVLKYVAFIPVVAWLPVISEPWIEARTEDFILAAIVIAATHLIFRGLYRGIIREHCNMPALEEDEENFPLKLDLRN